MIILFISLKLSDCIFNFIMIKANQKHVRPIKVPFGEAYKEKKCEKVLFS